MPDPNLNDNSFFREAIQCVASSLDLSQAMLAVYEFLKHHFPLVGLTFHKYDHNLGVLHLLFIVTEGKFQHLNETVNLSQEAKQLILLREKECGVNYVPHTLRRPVTLLIQPAIHSYLPNVDRGSLVAMLSANDRVIGHLNLFGEKPECFAPEHVRKFSMLRPAFSLLMMNLLKHKEVFELQQRLSAENRKLVNEVNRLRDETIVGSKGGLRPVMEMVRQLSGRDVPVLITGETGTGKELIADVIQQMSPRSHAPYVKVNCGAIPDSLIDSELFGHEKGAFTGAVSARAGRFEQAHGGTLFLDEVGDMPLEAQRRLLRVLQNGIVERVGGSQKLNINARIIAATHRNIDEMILQGQFRSDLFYRLNVFPVHLPPLHERQQDIPALIHHFLTKKAKRLMLDRAPLLASESLPALLAYTWPGNVRELENIVERALIINHHGPIQLDQYLPMNAVIHCQPGPNSFKERDCSEKNLREGKMEADYEKSGLGNLDDILANHIRLALQASNGIIHGPKGAAKKLGINPSTLRKRMDKLQIVYGRKSSLP
jgi:transcriptional regulator with GAF, ATPase, and Fis domain